MPYRLTEERQRHRAERAAALLDAARRLFETQGYHATTMQQVVHAAGTSIGNAYFYFPNKEALLRALVEQTLAEIQAAVDAAEAGQPPGPALLARSLYGGVVAALERSALMRAWLVEAGLPELRADALAHFVVRARGFFEIAPELLRGLDADLVAHAWHGSTFHVVEAVIAGALPNDPPRLGRFVALWNLQALGLPRSAIQQALAALPDGGSCHPLPSGVFAVSRRDCAAPPNG